MSFLGIRSGARVAVAMSGGVDSSVTAALLREAGYDVFGVTMALWSCHAADRARKQTCCSTVDVEDARAVCERLGIPHVVADFRTEFRRQVIEHFVDEYARGRTPIPCIGCNQYFKFERLWTYVRDAHGADYIATGHYARIARAVDGTATGLLRGCDRKKDQSYYLFVMTQAQLQHSLFPLGELTKPEVRAHAARHGLVTAEKPESFEICFVPDNEYATFIEDFYPEKAGTPGVFVDTHGHVLGRHRGTHAYTIGQRRGLGLGGGNRRYVTAIDPQTNTVHLGDVDDLQSPGLQADGWHWIGAAPSADVPVRGWAKIRAAHAPAACTVTARDGEVIEVWFDEAQSAITPGQAVVLYGDEDRVLGGGWIARAMTNARTSHAMAPHHAGADARCHRA